MKTCKECSVEKELTEYYKGRTICKKCVLITDKIYREKNKDLIKLKKNTHYNTNKEKNKEKRLDRAKSYRLKNPEKVAMVNKKWRENNKDKLNAATKKWRENNKEKIKIENKKYHCTDKAKEQRKQYDIKNKEHIRIVRHKYIDQKREYINKRERDRKKTDSLFRLRINTRSMIQKSIKNKGYTKKSRTYEILGCSYEEFKAYLESKFEWWMNWENYGKYEVGKFNIGWDIDHIKPLASDKSEEGIIRLNNYLNLQPLCSYTNRHIKGYNINYYQYI